MSEMFEGCIDLTNLNLSSFNISQVTNMSNMFKECTNLQTIYVNPSTWITNQANTNDMFTDCGVGEVTPKP